MNKKLLWVNKLQRCELAMKERWAIIRTAWNDCKKGNISRKEYDDILYNTNCKYYNKRDYINCDTKIREVE